MTHVPEVVGGHPSSQGRRRLQYTYGAPEDTAHDLNGETFQDEADFTGKNFLGRSIEPSAKRQKQNQEE